MGLRGNYNAIASNDEEEDTQQQSQQAAGNVATSVRSATTLSTSSRGYERIANNDDEEEEGYDNHGNDVELGGATATTGSGNKNNTVMESKRNDGIIQGKKGSTDPADEDDDAEKITVLILDLTNSRFQVKVSPAWTVLKLKEVGVSIHKVQPDRQRLVFRGRFLEDEKTLEESGIHEENIIIHLFPKPRVVISNQSSDSCNGTDTETSDAVAGVGQGGGARVPTIVLDAEEAERRSQILVLGSAEYIEAQNNVKLFSFILLIISSIELLNLMAIALGVQQEEQSSTTGAGGEDGFVYTKNDDNVDPDTGNVWEQGGNDNVDSNITLSDHSYSDPALELYSQWGPLNYVDLTVSALGVYVAFIGLKASHENTLQLARQYLFGTFVVGTLWLSFNYYVSVQFNKEIEEVDDDLNVSDADPYQGALQVMVIPSLIWILCCFRAWQFQNLLREAEEEAVGRIQTQLEQIQQSNRQQHQPERDTQQTQQQDQTNNTNNESNNDGDDALENLVSQAIYT